MDACQEYINSTHRRVTIEWALIAGVNDSIDQADKLISWIGGKLFHVNLIQLNPVEHYQKSPSEDDQTLAFQTHLQSAGIACSIRSRRGIDIQAGCGQLASKTN
jgi:23S rRNA (adenine2503-C2)-methyltransferase